MRGGRFHGLRRTPALRPQQSAGPLCLQGTQSLPPWSLQLPLKNRESHSGTAPTSAWHTPTHSCVQLQLCKP